MSGDLFKSTFPKWPGWNAFVAQTGLIGTVIFGGGFLFRVLDPNAGRSGSAGLYAILTAVSASALAIAVYRRRSNAAETVIEPK